MYPLQGEASQDEPMAYEYHHQTKGEIWWLVGTVVGTSLAILVTRKMLWNDDEDAITLHILHYTIKALQKTARVLGQWAIELEKEYNDVAESLH